MPTKEEAKKGIIEAIRKLYNDKSKDNHIFQGQMVSGRIIKSYHPKYVYYLEQLLVEAVLAGKIVTEDSQQIRKDDREYQKNIERQKRQGKKND